MLHVAKQAHAVVWTVDRPEARNALDGETMTALAEAMSAAAADAAIRAAVIAGAGPVFVSGGDLRELRGKHSREEAETLSEMGYRLTHAIGELPFPVIAAMNGPAIGGGAELAVACDMRIAEPRASIAFKQARMAVTTAWGTVPRLVALVGAGRAARLLYSARDVGADEGKAIGLFDEVVAEGTAVATALAWADEIAAASPTAVRGMKRLVRETASGAAAAATRALEKDLFVETWSGPDHIEAVEAYFEKRAPRWR